MTNLKDINFGLNQYCGPSVLSAMTGRSTDECAAVISQVSGRKEIKAVEMHYIRLAFEKLRFMVTPVNSYSYTLFGTLHGLANKDGMYIIGVPKHVVAVEVKDNKVYLIDNHTKSPIDASGSARLSQKVDIVYRITPRPLPKLLQSKIRIDNDKTNRLIRITAVNEYEDSGDNTIVQLGSFRYRSQDELNLIVDSLKEIQS